MKIMHYRSIRRRNTANYHQTNRNFHHHSLQQPSHTRHEIESSLPPLQTTSSTSMAAYNMEHSFQIPTSHASAPQNSLRRQDYYTLARHPKLPTNSSKRQHDEHFQIERVYPPSFSPRRFSVLRCCPSGLVEDLDGSQRVSQVFTDRRGVKVWGERKPRERREVQRREEEVGEEEAAKPHSTAPSHSSLVFSTSI